MITNLRNILNINTIEDIYIQYIQLEESLNIYKSELDELVLQQYDFTEGCRSKINELTNSIVKGNDDGHDLHNIKKNILKKYNERYVSYIEECAEIKKNIEKTETKINNIIKSNPILIDKEKEDFFKSIIIITNAYSNKQISDQRFDVIKKQIKNKIIEKGWGVSILTNTIKSNKINNLKKSLFPEVIEHIKELLKNKKKKKTIYVDAIIKNNKDEILFLKRTSQSNFEPNKWGLPGGHLNEGETLEEGIKREVIEETGIEIKDCKKIFTFESKDCIIYYFECIPVNDKYEVTLVENEHSNYIFSKNWNELELLVDLKNNLEKIYNKEYKINN